VEILVVQCYLFKDTISALEPINISSRFSRIMHGFGPYGGPAVIGIKDCLISDHPQSSSSFKPAEIALFWHVQPLFMH